MKRKASAKAKKAPAADGALLITPLDSVAGLRERARRACQTSLEALERRQAAGGAYNKADASTAANLARAISTVAAEDRKSDEDELAAVRLMGPLERLPVLMTWLLEQPVTTRRVALAQLEASFQQPKVAS